MSLIDWDAINCDGMKAYCDALRRLESAVETLLRHQGCLEAEVGQLRTQVAALTLLISPAVTVMGPRDPAEHRYIYTPGYPQEDFDGDSRDD